MSIDFVIFVPKHQKVFTPEQFWTLTTSELDQLIKQKVEIIIIDP